MIFTRSKVALGALIFALAGGLLGGVAWATAAASAAWMDHLQAFFANNLTLAVLLTLLIFLTSWRRDRLTLSTNLNKQIQDYNLAIFKDPSLAGQVGADSFPKSEASWVQGLYATFYTINMVRDGKHIRERLFVRSSDLFREDEFIWLTAADYPEQLIYILDGERGYHPDFKAFIWSILKRRYTNDWIENVRERYRARLAREDQGSHAAALRQPEEALMIESGNGRGEGGTDAAALAAGGLAIVLATYMDEGSYDLISAVVAVTLSCVLLAYLAGNSTRLGQRVAFAAVTGLAATPLAAFLLELSLADDHSNFFKWSVSGFTTEVLEKSEPTSRVGDLAILVSWLVLTAAAAWYDKIRSIQAGGAAVSSTEGKSQPVNSDG